MSNAARGYGFRAQLYAAALLACVSAAFERVIEIERERERNREQER